MIVYVYQNRLLHRKPLQYYMLRLNYDAIYCKEYFLILSLICNDVYWVGYVAPAVDIEEQ